MHSALNCPWFAWNYCNSQTDWNCNRLTAMGCMATTNNIQLSTDWLIKKTHTQCPVRLADKPWLKVLLTDLLWEKNTVRWLKKYDLQAKRTGRGPSQAAQHSMLAGASCRQPQICWSSYCTVLQHVNQLWSTKMSNSSISIARQIMNGTYEFDWPT